ncbi:hypothetical protein EH30_01110 [Erythrobacter sp. JL475]|nr:hypothetical protein EH30_01110 [Erythrobacter sp. JL475]
MARDNQGFTNSRSSGPKMALFIGTALASLALAGCAASAPPAEVSFTKAQAALQNGKVDNAVAHAEAAVLAEPRNAGFRALLGASYLEAGRFQSAATAFGEAIELGDSDPRTVLSYALAQVAIGNNTAALQTLQAHESAIPAADLGLAMALAGAPERGVHYLVNTVRNGDTSAKARQNLAYSYALAGNWPAARVMAAEDVPADQLDARLTEWASTARPEDHMVRVAKLLGISPVADGGQPQHLALANFPSQQVLVAEAETGSSDAAPAEFAEAKPTQSEAMAFGIRDIDTVYVEDKDEDAVETVDPTPRAASPVRVAEAAPAVTAPVRSSAPAPVATPVAAAAPSRGAPRFVSNAVVQQVPVSAPRPAQAARPQPVRAPAQARAAAQPMAVATGADATHLVQLGAFESRAVAESKWREFQRRFPQLSKHDVVITEAKVNGRTFFRVAAAGFTSRTASSMCGTVKSSGRGCFAYAASNPPAGAVDNGVRVAARSR